MGRQGWRNLQKGLRTVVFCQQTMCMCAVCSVVSWAVHPRVPRAPARRPDSCLPTSTQIYMSIERHQRSGPMHASLPFAAQLYYSTQAAMTLPGAPDGIRPQALKRAQRASAPPAAGGLLQQARRHLWAACASVADPGVSRGAAWCAALLLRRSRCRPAAAAAQPLMAHPSQRSPRFLAA